jgi:hypothetical protein
MPGKTTMSNVKNTRSGAPQRLSTAFSRVFELRADTAPGESGPMAAPKNCSSPRAYRAEIRRRFACDRAVRQQITVMARRLRGAQHHRPVPVTGPFAGEAREILASIRERHA